MKRGAIHLPKQTMWDNLVRVDELVARPTLKQMHTEVPEEPALHADETLATLHIEGGKGTKTDYASGWRNVRARPACQVTRGTSNGARLRVA